MKAVLIKFKFNRPNFRYLGLKKPPEDLKSLLTCWWDNTTLSSWKCTCTDIKLKKKNPFYFLALLPIVQHFSLSSQLTTCVSPSRDPGPRFTDPLPLSLLDWSKSLYFTTDQVLSCDIECIHSKVCCSLIKYSSECLCPGDCNQYGAVTILPYKIHI